jgi:predicted DsbA family dithiol-disulfide isomerase
VWLHNVQEELGDHLEITWRSFSLEQANRTNRALEPEWRVWEQPDDYPSRGLWPFRAAEAARNQSPAAYNRYRMALLRAKHEDQRDIADRKVLCDVAQEESLDLEQFEADLADRRLLERIGNDHTRAIQRFDVFGTPTLAFGPGQVAYVKMLPPPPAEEALSVFDAVRGLVADLPAVLEVKRPQKRRQL